MWPRGKAEIEADGDDYYEVEEAFEAPHLHHEGGAQKSKSSGGRSQFIGAVANLAVQYNFSCLGIALAVMTSHWDKTVTDDNGLTADYPEPVWAHNALMGTVFAGAIVGMITMGYVGDRIGRRRGMIATQALVVVGALASALLTWGSASDIYAILAACRFILGFGVGGIYPMSAAMTHEAAPSEGEEEHAAHASAQSRVGWAFFWQSPGAMLPYVLFIPLYYMPSEAWTTDVQFRLLLGCGALVSAVPLVAAFYAPEPPLPPAAAARFGRGGSGVNVDGGYEEDDAEFAGQLIAPSEGAAGGAGVLAAPGAWTHWLTLIGTGGTWFLYDVAYYSTNVFTPSILLGIFGADDSLGQVTWQSLVTTAMGIPGSFLAILLLRWVPGRWLSVWGFVFIALCFGLLGGAFAAYPGNGEASDLKFALFCLATFALNFGPNVSTYVLPASSFPQQIRGTFHGLSAASGKAGAVFGTFVYPILQTHLGLASIMWMQVAVSLLGAVISVVFLRPYYPPGVSPAPRGTLRAWLEYFSLSWH